MEKSGKNCLKSLTHNQRLAAQLIGRGENQKAVADQVGVTPRTLRNWAKLKEFRQACDLFYKEQSNQLAYYSNQIRSRVSDALLEIVEDDKAEHADRIRAGKLLLENSLMLRLTKPQYGDELFEDPEEPTSHYQQGRNDFYGSQMYNAGMLSAIKEADEAVRKVDIEIRAKRRKALDSKPEQSE